MKIQENSSSSQTKEENLNRARESAQAMQEKIGFSNQRSIGNKRLLNETFANYDDDDVTIGDGNSDISEENTFGSNKKFKSDFIVTNKYKNYQPYGNISSAVVESMIQTLIEMGLVSLVDNDTISNGANITSIRDFVRSMLLPNKILSESMIKFIAPFFHEIPQSYIRNVRLRGYFDKGAGMKSSNWLKYSIEMIMKYSH